MPQIYHQSVEEILRAATPEQKIMWNYLFLRFGERCAISQYYYAGAIAGHEMLTFTARKLFVCYQLSTEGGNGSVNGPVIQTYDENNAASMQIAGSNPYWDATAAAVRYNTATSTLNNIYFSRIVNIGFNRILFIGYRLIY